MCRMIPGMKKLIFQGDSIYPNPEYDKQLRELMQTVGTRGDVFVIHLRVFVFNQLSQLLVIFRIGVDAVSQENQFLHTGNHPAHQLYNAVRKTDKTTGILVSTWFTESFTSSNFLINAYRSIASISAPLFTIRYAGMDDGGMVGGYMYNDQIFTRQLLKTIDEILHGKKASDIPGIILHISCTFSSR